MKFSVFSCLVAAAVLVVFAQQSEAGEIFDKITNYIEDGIDAIENKLDPGMKRYYDAIAFIKQLFQENINANTDGDASMKLREGFFIASKMLNNSRSRMIDGVLAAEKILGKNPEGARKLTQQSLVDGESIAYYTAPFFYEAIGEALYLSNDGARPGLLSAIEYIQKGALALLNLLKSGVSLFDNGSEAGGTAAQASLKVYHLCIETGYAAIFYDIQKSANESLQALRDAQSSPIRLQIENRNCGVTAKGDPECSDALEVINQVANNSLKNGANPALVQEFEEIFKCAFDSLVKIAVDAERILGNTKTIGEIDTFAATAMYSKENENFKKWINQIFATLYLDLGDVFARSGIQLDKEAQSVFVNLEKANFIMFNTIAFTKEVIINGLQNGGDASMLALETVANAIYFAKLVFIQSVLESAKVVFSLL